MFVLLLVVQLDFVDVVVLELFDGSVSLGNHSVTQVSE